MSMDRRLFANRLMGSSLVAMLAALFTPVVAFLRPQADLAADSDTALDPLGEPLDAAAMVQGGSTLGVLAGEKVVVVRRGPEDFAVLTATCTHLGCLVHFENEGLVCPCHGGRYDLDGRVTGGPPPDPLRRIKVRLEGSYLRRA